MAELIRRGTKRLGFFDADPVARPAAYTQTYSTAARAHPAATAAAVATTAATSDTPFGYSEAQANALVAAVNAVQVDLLAVKKLLNSVVDDLQALGLLQ